MSECNLKDLTLQELWELFPVTLEPHNPDWKVWAAEETAFLVELLSDYQLSVNHIGSTAVEGICAKPVIDILLLTGSESGWTEMRRILESAGYICMSESAGRMSFNKGYTPSGYAGRVFHLHFHLTGDDDELLFRDYLKANPDAARDYELLKLSLLPRFRNDRDGYTAAKSEFIKGIVEKAKQGI